MVSVDIWPPGAGSTPDTKAPNPIWLATKGAAPDSPATLKSTRGYNLAGQVHEVVLAPVTQMVRVPAF